MPIPVQVLIAIIGGIGLVGAFIILIGIWGSHQNPYGL